MDHLAQAGQALRVARLQRLTTRGIQHADRRAADPRGISQERAQVLRADQIQQPWLLN